MEDTFQADQETIREFLVESHENLSRLEIDLVELEKHPQDAALLGNIFRTFHTIKGASGFLAFSTLETITHEAETLLSQLRTGQRQLTPALVSLVLETVDATRKVLAAIETERHEGGLRFDDLVARLRSAAKTNLDPAAPAPQVSAIPPEPSPLPAPIPFTVAETLMSEAANPPESDTKPVTRSDDDDSARPSAADANIRVGVLLLDKLMDLVGELVLARNQILQFNAEREDAQLNATSQRLNIITSELQEGVMKTRMQPIGVVWNNLPRGARHGRLARQADTAQDGRRRD